MAQIDNTSANKKFGISLKRRKLSTRIDLTPMVDLGFLLITFFIFTTSIAKPVAMKLNLADDGPNHYPSQVSEEKTITFILGKDNNVFYYAGLFTGRLSKISFNEVRETIMEKKQQVMGGFGDKEVTVLIKPSVKSNYKNVIDCLDEMIINNITLYVLDEPNKAELISLKSIK